MGNTKSETECSAACDCYPAVEVYSQDAVHAVVMPRSSAAQRKLLKSYHFRQGEVGNGPEITCEDCDKSGNETPEPEGSGALHCYTAGEISSDCGKLAGVLTSLGVDVTVCESSLGHDFHYEYMLLGHWPNESTDELLKRANVSFEFENGELVTWPEELTLYEFRRRLRVNAV